MTRDFISNDSNVVMFNSSLNPVQVIGNDTLYPKGAPCFDASGYLYFPGTDLQRTSRKARTTSTSAFLLEDIENVLSDELPGLLMSDFSSNLMSQGNLGSAYRISEIERLYDYRETDPIYEDSAIPHAPDGIVDGTSDNNNYGIMFEDFKHNYSMMVTIGNTDFDDPNPVDGENIPMFYNDFRPGYFIIELTRFDHGIEDNDIEKYVYKEGYTYGGLAPYKTNESNINALFGADTGWLYSWKHHLPAEAVRYPYQLDVGEPIITNISNSKFQRDVTNNCSYTWADNCGITVVDVLEGVTIDRIFANGYLRQGCIGELENTYHASFDRLPAHPNYTVGFSYVSGEGEDQEIVSEVFRHVEMYDQEEIYLPFKRDLVVPRDQEFHITYDNIHYNSITIEPGGTLFVEAIGVYTDTLWINNEATLDIDDEADLEANVCQCINECDPAADQYSLIQLNESGTLTINTMEFLRYDDVDDAWCVVVGDPDNTMTVSNLYMQSQGYPAETRLDIGSGMLQNEPSPILSVYELDTRGVINVYGTLEVTGRMYQRNHATIEVHEDAQFIATLAINNPYAVVDLNMKFTIDDDDDPVAADQFIICYGAELILDRADFDTQNFSPRIDIYGDMRLINGSQCDLWGGMLALHNGSHLFLSGGSLLEISSDDYYGVTATLKLHDNVTITGETPAQSLVHGDRIVVKGGGTIQPYDEDAYLENITIETSSDRWEGITYKYTFGTDELKFSALNVSGIYALIFSANDDLSLEIIDSNFEDCGYGLKLSGLFPARIEGCDFTDCKYGIYADEVPQIYVTKYQASPDVFYPSTFTGNQYGLVIRDADNLEPEEISNCTFTGNTTTALLCYESWINVGGKWDNPDYISLGSCTFTNNGRAIEASIAEPIRESVIMDCAFENNSENAIYVSDQYLRIYNNVIHHNDLNGLWGYSGALRELKENSITNNGGAEVIGCRYFMQGMVNGNNTFYDPGYTAVPQGEKPDYWNAAEMDRYILVKTDMTRPADVFGNTFENENDGDFEDRFYPSYFAFNFEEGQITGAEELYASGISDFESENYTSAKYTLTLLVTDYPESKEAISALIYFLYITAKTNQDYETLRQELNALVSEDYPDLYKEKEYVVTQSYLYEKNYTEVIERLEETITSPDTKMDSVVAVATQGYCYVQLAETGDRALPQQCTVRTKTFEEYLEYMRNLRMFLSGETESQEAPAYKFSLDANYPNPFNPTTTISFSIPKDDKVVLKVYNIKGQLVKTLVNDQLEAGSHKAVWNGDNKYGKNVSSGIYLYRLESGGKSKAQKMLLLK